MWYGRVLVQAGTNCGRRSVAMCAGRGSNVGLLGLLRLEGACRGEFFVESAEPDIAAQGVGESESLLSDGLAEARWVYDSSEARTENGAG